MHFLFLVACSLLLSIASGWAQNHSSTYDFAIRESFLKHWYSLHTIQPTLRLKLNARTGSVHSISADCEIHIAATPTTMELGSPNDVIVEPPNLCKSFPPGVTSVSENKLRNEVWPDLLDEQVMDRECDVKGFLRIFTEHAQNGHDPANPNHHFEVHPVTNINCGGSDLSFQSYLKAYEGMRLITVESAKKCIDGRRLKVRYNSSKKNYEFVEWGGGPCGNFAIVEVTTTNPDWVRTTDGGHTAIVRVSADGETKENLKLYTLTGSESDQWLADVLNGSASGNQRKVLHGLFTYDYFAITKTLRSTSGNWKKPEDWIEIDHPLALIVFGETDTIPWDNE